MRTSTEFRFNFGQHAILVDIMNPAAYTVTVWLFAQDGNTHLNPRFREIKSKRPFISQGKALMYGRQLCRGATRHVRND